MLTGVVPTFVVMRAHDNAASVKVITYLNSKVAPLWLFEDVDNVTWQRER